MSAQCAVLGCFNVSNREKGVFLHRLPQLPTQREAWLAAIPTESKSKNFNVCSKHFKEEDFTCPADLAMIRRLKSDAVPSIFPSEKMVEIMKLLKPIRNISKKSTKKPKKPTFKPNTKKAVLDLISATCGKSDASESDNDDDLKVEQLSDDSFDDSDNETLNKIVDTPKKGSSFEVCRLCLDYEAKLFPVEKYGLEIFFQELLNIRITLQKFKNVNRSKEGFNHPYTIQEIDSYYIGDEITEDLYEDDYQEVKVNESVVMNNIERRHSDATIFENVVLPEVRTDLILDIDKETEFKKEMDMKVKYFDREETDQCDDNYDDDVCEEKQEEVKKTKVKPTRNQPATKKPLIKRQTRKSPTYLPWDPNNWERVRFTEEKILDTIRKREESVLYKDAPYKCELCYRVFKGREAYDAHMYFHSPARGEFECKFCKIRFRMRCRRNRHLEQHYITFKCKRCSYQGTSTSNARLHDKFHMGVTYHCEACQKSFTKHTTYMGHVRLKHRSQHVCPGCGENFLSEQAVAVHFKWKHPGMEWPVHGGSEGDALYCAVCQLQFCNERAYSTHFIMSTKHGDSSQEDAKKTKQKTPIKTDCPEVEPTTNQPATKKPSIKRQTRKSPTYPSLDPNNWERVRFTEEKILDMIRKRKESVLYKDAPYKCELCYRVFKGREAYDAHMYFHSPARGEVECKFCKFRFRMHCLRNEHLKQHYITYNCKRCPYQGMSAPNARLHNKLHMGVTYDCEACHKTFTIYRTYTEHVRRYHRSQHVCPGCGENFLSKQAVALHFKWKHPGMEWPVHGGSEGEALYCAVCQIQFCNAPAYSTHFIMSTNHSDLGDSSKKKVSLYWQNRRSSKDPMKTKQKRPIETDCPECGEQFASNKAYVRHHRAQHPAAPVRVARRYMCEICGNKYPSNSQLDYHRTMHTGMTPYSCDVCGKRFRLKRYLVRHTQMHTGVRPFECGECGKRFTTKMGSQLHMRHVHQRVPWPRRQRTRHHADAPPHSP